MKIDILGVLIDSLNMRETVAVISQAIVNKSSLRVVTANPEMIYQATYDDRLRRIINSAGLVTPDGIGVVWAAGQFGFPLRERVTGIDLLEQLLPAADIAGWRIFLLGSKPGVADLAALKINRRYERITLQTRHGYFQVGEESEIVQQIKEFQPDLLLVGLGSPRQEYWVAEHDGLATVSLGVGGSFDVLAEIVPRAPQRIQELHLEWLYRLFKEPWRLQRQGVLPKFALKVLKQKYKS